MSALPIISERDALLSAAHTCSLCPRMGESKRVLTDLNGPWDAQVVFVAEAPGRLGAEVTGIPLLGDRTGDRFEELLRNMRWSRCDVFVTNAVLCNPRDDKGNNDTPKGHEIANCSQILRRTIELINPRLVITLGRVALGALRAIEDHQCDLRSCAGMIVPWHKRKLGVLYHPGPRTVVHRCWAQQAHDARHLAELSAEFLDFRTSNHDRLAGEVPVSLDYRAI